MGMSRRETILRTMQRLEEELIALERFPEEDPYEDGTVLSWERQYEPGGWVFTYAALKAGGQWYVTGKATPKYMYTWRELVDKYLAQADSEVFIATQWEEVT